jgi:hypothetical protein
LVTRKLYPSGNFIPRQLMTKLLADSAYTAPHQAMLVRHLVQRLVSKAFRGDIIAIKEVANRVEGSYRPKLVTAGIGKAAYRGGA